MGKRLMKFRPRISPQALGELHHMQYGGAWSKGRDQFIFLRGHGLQVSCQPKIKVGVETRTDAAEI